MEQIDALKVKELIDTGNVTIIDIQDVDSFNQAHIEYAIHVYNENLEEFVKNTDKDKPLICYCYHGVSSQNAALYFHNAGFKIVYSMIGGFENWREVYPTVSQDQIG